MDLCATQKAAFRGWLSYERISCKQTDDVSKQRRVRAATEPKLTVFTSIFALQSDQKVAEHPRDVLATILGQHADAAFTFFRQSESDTRYNNRKLRIPNSVKNCIKKFTNLAIFSNSLKFVELLS